MMLKKIDEITGLRCLAVMMVVLDHAGHTLENGYSGWLTPMNLFSHGYQGVLIFFVLSGFLITNILKREIDLTGKVNFADFYLRRSLRIWPASYAFLIFLTILSFSGILHMSWQQLTTAALHLWNYSAFFGLTENYNLFPEGKWYLGHFWSLALEEQFYWVWPPLLIWMARSQSWRFLPGLILFIPIVRMSSYVLFPAYRDSLGMMLHTGVDAILIGCYAALKQDKIKQFLDSPKVTATLINIVTFVFLIIIPFIASRAGGYWAATYGRTIEAALAALLILTIIHRENFWLSKILRTKFFVSIGTVSFSLYLWQQVFTGIGSPIGWVYPFNIFQAIAAAYLSYWLIETPFLRINEKMKMKKAAAIHQAVLAKAQDRKDPSPS